MGVIITATQEMKKNGNFDGAIGTFEKFIYHLKPMMNQLNVPLLLIGLKAPKTFKIVKKKEKERKLGTVIKLKQNDLQNS